jgi:D-glycerate 3-kinase
VLGQDALIKIVANSVERQLDKPGQLVVVGIAGSQGSGKTTLAAELAVHFRSRDLPTAVLSIDDLYLGKAAREELAERVHPLLRVRGVPGTHDLRLGLAILARLDAGNGAMLPRFDKSIDDRQPFDQWDWAPPETRVLILEGWCLGAEPVDRRSLRRPVNKLEANEDRARKWRRYVNARLAGDYQQFFRRIDLLLFLKAPDFETVCGWRREQEQQLLARTGRGMSEAELERFMLYYGRITEQMLSSTPASANITVVLDKQRRPVDMQFNEPFTMARSSGSGDRGSGDRGSGDGFR